MSYPAASYGIHVRPTGDKKSPVAWDRRIKPGDHETYASMVRKEVERSGRKPDILSVALPVSTHGQYDFLGSAIYARDYGVDLFNGLEDWVQLASDWGCPFLLYLGSLWRGAGDAIWQAHEGEWLDLLGSMMDRLRLSLRKGDYLCADESARHSGMGIEVEDRRRGAWLARCDSLGLKPAVEAWPHEECDRLLGDAPAVMLYRGAFLSQHPAVSPHKWRQSDHHNRVGLVWIEEPNDSTPETAQQLVASNCVPSFDWQVWYDVADKLPNAPPRL